ncbi:hypothetical protein [Novosphingobium sp. Leaf2]|uniref:hypothetical protein n=1 Tax=Novosphingobium sp. Leaf2 TaxID=1735670 RepID=UPI0006FC2702|nr:hypothetical protein [Novosphingobium sp. Leaf2]KQM17508.1 hypothetical protein ASE49_10740 [Novosphingobium sp. Leaf2]
MATVRGFDMLEQGAEHATAPCVAKLVPLKLDGELFLQLNGYGHPNRGPDAGRTQNFRLSKAAFEQLVAVGNKHFGIVK